MARVYISGPMSSIPDFNFPAFHAAAAEWRREGWEVVNPAEHFSGRTDLLRAEYIREDVTKLLECSAIAVLPGWQRSAGASLEVALARELGLDVYDAGTFAPYRETVLDEAKRLVYGDRQAAYDHPLVDYTRTAAIWSAVLGTPVTAEQAILCMIGVKLSRLAHASKRDSIVDVAGYAECLQRVVEERERRARATDGA